MKVDQLLDRLEYVKPTGKGKWLCRGPARDDKSPSLQVQEADDGRILIHCFAGCGSADILDSLGLDFGALFPDTDTARYVPIRKREKVSQSDYYKALLEICESDRKQGKTLTEKQLDQELEAYKFLRAAS
jgi:hypothetical protein